jgi:hypothetical protein
MKNEMQLIFIIVDLCVLHKYTTYIPSVHNFI